MKDMTMFGGQRPMNSMEGMTSKLDGAQIAGGGKVNMKNGKTKGERN
jgi:hypothetical protein